MYRNPCGIIFVVVLATINWDFGGVPMFFISPPASAAGTVAADGKHQCDAVQVPFGIRLSQLLTNMLYILVFDVGFTSAFYRLQFAL
jgi:hypothetical protein